MQGLKASTLRLQCPLRVRRRRPRAFGRCPLLLQYQTLVGMPCYRCELGASARHKAADLGVAVTVVIGPHNSRTKAVVRRPDLSRSLRLHGARQGQAARWLRAPWPGTRHCRRVRSAPGAAGGTSANPICPRQCQSSRRRIDIFTGRPS